MGGELVPRHEAELAPTASPLEQLVGAWLVGFGNRSTREAYGRDLRDFVAWCSEHKLELLDVARPHVDAYARTLETRGRAPATIARRLSALASFYAYAVDEGALSRSPAARVRRPRVSDESPTLGLDRDELDAFLAAAARLDARAEALACLLALNGLRVSEACDADVASLGEVRGHHVLQITRKRGKRATVPLAPRSFDALSRCLAGRDGGPLLLDDAGRRLDRHDAARIVRRAARAAGIVKRISPHSLRHTFVTLSLDSGVPLRDVQDAAGHADPRTTRRYDRARQSLDRHPTYRLAAFLAEVTEVPPVEES